MVTKKEEIEDYDKYEKQIQDVDELEGTDVKINPDYYIHLALVKLSATFDGSVTIKESFERYRHIIEHIEILCDASNMLTNDYYEEVKKYKNSSEYIQEETNYVKSANLARHKLKLMMRQVFSHKVATDPLRY
jgi:hypothetical protein